MLGKVTLPIDDGEAVATLEDDMTWSFAGPEIGTGLLRTQAEFIEPYGGPSDGRPGARMLGELAEKTKGTVEMPEMEEDPSGTVY
jgi:hypothetical protein